MSFLRARQRTLTALFPHQANPTTYIPNRGPRNAAPAAVGQIAGATTYVIPFTAAISTKAGNTDGFTVTVNAIAGTVTDVQPTGAAELTITFTPVGLALQVIEITYDGTGVLIETLSLKPVAAFVVSGAVP